MKTGIALILGGSVLLAILLYEPANLVNALLLSGIVNEGAVALLTLLLVAACGLGGLRAIFRQQRTF